MLRKKDLETANFNNTWFQRIAKIPDVDWNSSLDVLVARLIALATIEGATSLIHEQMRSGVLQSTTKKDYLERQMGSFGINQEFKKKTVSEHSEVDGRKGKKRFILWTKTQMAVIAKVFEHVTTSQDRGLRFLVTGEEELGKRCCWYSLPKWCRAS